MKDRLYNAFVTVAMTVAAGIATYHAICFACEKLGM